MMRLLSVQLPINKVLHHALHLVNSGRVGTSCLKELVACPPVRIQDGNF